jgi:hypothetical protein
VEDRDAKRQVVGRQSWSVDVTMQRAVCRCLNEAKRREQLTTPLAERRYAMKHLRKVRLWRAPRPHPSPEAVHLRDGSMKQVAAPKMWSVSGRQRQLPAHSWSRIVLHGSTPKGVAVECRSGDEASCCRAGSGLPNLQQATATVAVESERESASTDCETKAVRGFETVCPCGRERVAPRKGRDAHATVLTPVRMRDGLPEHGIGCNASALRRYRGRPVASSCPARADRTSLRL